MIGPVWRECRDCHERRYVYPATVAQRADIVQGKRRCGPCSTAVRRRPRDVDRPPADEIVVDRLVRGVRVRSEIEDRVEVVRLLTDRSARELAELLGVTPRTVVRYRQEIRT